MYLAQGSIKLSGRCSPCFFHGLISNYYDQKSQFFFKNESQIGYYSFPMNSQNRSLAHVSPQTYSAFYRKFRMISIDRNLVNNLIEVLLFDADQLTVVNFRSHRSAVMQNLRRCSDTKTTRTNASKFITLPSIHHLGLV